MDFKAKETIKWYEQFDNTNLIIKNNFKDINIKILKDNLPHLLGLHYMYSGNKIPPARVIAEEIKAKNISDEEIFKNVKKHNFNMLKSVKNRVRTFKEFLENFENGIILENTKEDTNINSTLFVIKTKEKKIMHLGIKEISGVIMLENYSEMNQKEMRGIFETYFLRNNDKFTQNSKIHESITEISRYDEKLKEYLPFSFDNQRNQELLKKYYLKKKENHNCLTGEPINIQVHSSGESKWIGKKDVEKYGIEKMEGAREIIGQITYIENNKLYQKSVSYYNISELKITKEIDQKFVPMKEKEKTQEIDKSKGQGIGD
ncbi:PBECR4 domain-containing protein [Fusobacterium animalis]|uniref:PBECR4 domain-containing protein n=1 Tax=Fusobacterium animalis TaxID=76859 RepID=UPI0030CA9D07